VIAWLRQMLGLPDGFDGMFTDTASISTLLSLVAARHAVPGLDARDEGLSGRPSENPVWDKWRCASTSPGPRQRPQTPWVETPG